MFKKFKSGISVLVAVSVILLIALAGCGEGEEEDSDKTGKKKRDKPSTDKVQETDGNSTAATGNPNLSEASAVTEEDLMAMLESSVSGNVLWSFCADFDGDNVQEVFAFIGEEFGEFNTEAELWFVSKDGARLVEEKKGYYLPADVWMVGDIKMMYVEEGYGGSGTTSHAWLVKEGNPSQFSDIGMNLRYEGGGEFTAVGGAFDASTDGTGHTYKRYYLHFDGTAFTEYGGISITENQFVSIDGASGVIADIKAKGYAITDILYRENGIVNINYTNGFSNENATLRINANTAELVEFEDWGEDSLENSSYGGIYDATHFPHIAVYPESFPFDRTV